MSARPILVVDDEKHLRTALFTALTRMGHAVELAENGHEALSKFQSQRFDLVVTDLKMPGLDGLGLLKEIKKISPHTPVIVMTAYGTVDNAVAAMREGASDFLLKPFPSGVIEEAARSALSRNTEKTEMESVSSRKVEESLERPIITKSAKMRRLLDMARNVAQSPATVLLQGESGTGKELLARFLHQNSPRKDGPFVAINCASLPESLLESELFGHEKGAFTGAVARKQGKFELADGGTILLDEISEMDIALQAKLLRVLQEGEIDRVGGKNPQKIDVRVIATTNRNLKQYAEEGRFRQDLYYRLNVIPFFIPALKDRADDVPALAEFFREKYNRLNNKKVEGFSPEAFAALSDYHWPGNIRELENTVARGVLLCAGERIEALDLFMDEAGFMAALDRVSESPVRDEKDQAPDKKDNVAAIENEGRKNGPATTIFNGGENFDFSSTPKDEAELPASFAGDLMTIEEMERLLIGRALDETEGNRTHAARILGISVRTLRNKLAEYRA